MKRKTTAGLGWTSTAQIVVQITHMAVTVVLARLLLPKDFGLVGMAMVFTNVVMPTNELGLGSAIVQSRDVDNKQLSTVFWISLLLGLMSWLFTAAMSSTIAGFFKTADLQPVVIVIAFIFLMQSFTLVHSALLNKNLNFKAVALANIVGSVIYCVVAVALAFASFKVWSLVLGTLAQRFVYIAVIWINCRWRPSFVIDLRSIRNLLSYGLNLWGSTFITRISQNVDYLIVGKLLGATALGYYTIAFKLAELPKTRITTMISTVAFPAFSAVQDDPERLKRGYMKMTRYATMAVFPILATLLITADKFIPILYGPKWSPSILPFQILALMGLVTCAIHSSATIFLAKGLTATMFRLSLFLTIVLTTFAALGSNFGIVGVAVGVMFSVLIYASLVLRFSLRAIDLKFRDFLSAVYPPVVGCFTLGVTLIALTVSHLVTSSPIQLLAGIGFASIVYLFTLTRIDRGGIADLARIIAQSLPKGIVQVFKLKRWESM